jgi:acyl dehydratase
LDDSAAGGEITAEALEQLRKQIGTESTLPQFNTCASKDAIRHYIHGRGDDNPLFCDETYARSSCHGGIVAPGTFLLSCGFPRSRGLPGVHALFTGVDFHFHRPIKLDAKISAVASLHELSERIGEYAGRQFKQTTRTEYSDESGNSLATLYSHAFRMERGKAGKSNKFSHLARKTYSDDELNVIEQCYKQERSCRRGAVERLWDDIEIGDTLPTLVKGPLTVTDNIAFLIGFGTVFVKAHRQWFEFRERHPGVGVKDSYGVWDVPERVHWDEELAASVGMPGPYDYGPQRIAWIDHFISEWIGDDGWLRRLSVKLIAPNFVGDTSYIKGVVKEKSCSGVAVLEISIVDQRQRNTATAIAEVQLPCR